MLFNFVFFFLLVIHFAVFFLCCYSRLVFHLSLLKLDNNNWDNIVHQLVKHAEHRPTLISVYGCPLNDICYSWISFISINNEGPLTITGALKLSLYQKSKPGEWGSDLDKSEVCFSYIRCLFCVIPFF